MELAYVAEAIKAFEDNLKNACCDEDRKAAVKYLANKIGAPMANSVAMSHGLKREYYFA